MAAVPHSADRASAQLHPVTWLGLQAAYDALSAFCEQQRGLPDELVDRLVALEQELMRSPAPDFAAIHWKLNRLVREPGTQEAADALLGCDDVLRRAA